jgi:hypothetical protein
MMPSICLTAFLLAQIPHVELDFDSMIAKDWKGKRFGQIIPADAIKRLVRLRESGFARDVWNQQADYDALIAYLMESKETARDWALGGDEGTKAELIVLTKDDKLFQIEVIFAGPTPRAVFIHGKGAAARIDVKGFKYPEKK